MRSMVYKDSAWPTSLSASKDIGPRGEKKTDKPIKSRKSEKK